MSVLAYLLVQTKHCRNSPLACVEGLVGLTQADK